MPGEEHGIERMASVAALLAEPARLRILLTLIEREATVSELADGLGLAQPRVSTQLAALARAGLVSFERRGRHRLYAVDAARVEPVLTGLHLTAGGDARPGRRARREVAQDTPLRRARRCYDHLGGAEAVALLDAMIERGWLAAEPGAGGRVLYALAPDGEARLAARGLDLAAARRARRVYAFGCPDWTEGRPHLGGALGRAVADALERDGVVARSAGRREVTLARPLSGWLEA